MTTNRNLQLPDPTFPEHELLRDSAPIPELSAGFKGRVMAECSVSMASAARAWRWKVGTTTATVCALGLMICLMWSGDTDSSSAVIKQADSVPQPSLQSVPYESRPSASHLAADMPKPPVKKKKTSSSPSQELMDGLNQRKQMFDANMGTIF